MRPSSRENPSTEVDSKEEMIEFEIRFDNKGTERIFSHGRIRLSRRYTLIVLLCRKLFAFRKGE